MPCSEEEDAKETICVNPDRPDFRDVYCPIIDIVVINNSEVLEYRNRGYTVTRNGWRHFSDNFRAINTHIASSKTNTRPGVGYGPVVGSTINT